MRRGSNLEPCLENWGQEMPRLEFFIYWVMQPVSGTKFYSKRRSRLRSKTDNASEATRFQSCYQQILGLIVRLSLLWDWIPNLFTSWQVHIFIRMDYELKLVCVLGLFQFLIWWADVCSGFWRHFIHYTSPAFKNYEQAHLKNRNR